MNEAHPVPETSGEIDSTVRFAPPVVPTVRVTIKPDGGIELHDGVDLAETIRRLWQDRAASAAHSGHEPAFLGVMALLELRLLEQELRSAR